jgi:putative tributyrin esterase
MVTIMAYSQFSFESKYLNSKHTVSVLLPERPREVDPKKYYESGEKFKVLWLLHGTYGDHSDWMQDTMITLYARERNLIVVMPSALNSDYVDWPGFGMGFNMGAYLTEELMPLVFNWFPASLKPEDNYIAGLSMGGGGVLKYILNYPNKFAAGAVMSFFGRNFDRIDWTGKDTENRFSISAHRQQNSIANHGGIEKFKVSVDNVWAKMKELHAEGRLPRLYCTCGTADFLYNEYLSFKQDCVQAGMDVKFEEVEGFGHEWRFWDLAVKKSLDFFGIPEAYALGGG